MSPKYSDTAFGEGNDEISWICVNKAYNFRYGFEKKPFKFPFKWLQYLQGNKQVKNSKNLIVNLFFFQKLGCIVRDTLEGTYKKAWKLS